MRELPQAILRLYTIKGETRIAMADPGEGFEAGCVVSDPALPRRRLIFAGVAQDSAFVHYEEGGVARFIVIAFFRLKSPNTAVGVWNGFCDGRARSLDDLRRRMSCR
jgi:hypothetical protein